MIYEWFRGRCLKIIIKKKTLVIQFETLIATAWGEEEINTFSELKVVYWFFINSQRKGSRGQRSITPHFPWRSRTFSSFFFALLIFCLLYKICILMSKHKKLLPKGKKKIITVSVHNQSGGWAAAVCSFLLTKLATPSVPLPFANAHWQRKKETSWQWRKQINMHPKVRIQNF